MSAQQLGGQLITRLAALPAPSQNSAESRLVTVTFSSEQPVLRTNIFEAPWVEVLGHEAEEVDLARFQDGAAVLYNHDARDPASRLGVVERAWIEGGRGYAEIRISNRAEVDGIWRDIEDGVLRNISVGYRIYERVLQEKKQDEPNVYRVTQWEPVELSLVNIPADATVGVGRALDNNLEPDMHRNEQDWRAREADRRDGVRSVFEHFKDRTGMRAVMDACLDDCTVTVDEARTRILDELGRGVEPLGDPLARIGPGSERPSADFQHAAEDALLLRYGVKVEAPHPAAADLRGASVADIAKMCLSRAGSTYRGWSSEDVLTRAMTSSDLPNLLENVARKAAMVGFLEQEQATHRVWTRATELPDFKEASRIALSEAPGLAKVAEGAEYTYGALSDAKETIQVATYGKIVAISRQALINDDLGELVRLPLALGQAASRKEADLVYALLTSNPTMRDSTALFHADHGNLTSSGAAPSVTTLGEARAAMRKQKGLADAGYLNITPRYLIVPVALETAVEQLLATIQPSTTSESVPQWIRGLVVVPDPRLDDDSADAWYLAGSPQAHDTIEVATLAGQQPSVAQREEFDTDTMSWKVRVDVGAAVIDWRALYKNPGA